MSLHNQTLRLVQGVYWEYKGYLFDSGNVPIDLTGYRVRMKIRPNLESSSILAELTTENSRIELSTTETGVFFLILSALDTGIMPIGNHVFDIVMIPPDGKDFVIAEGARIKVVQYASR